MTCDRSEGREALLCGEIAENEFKRMATEAGLVPVKAAPDLTGWDFCVEPLEAPRARALDLSPVPPRWMVQVKAVLGQGAPRISLEHWLRMVADPAPWFVFVAAVENRRVTAAWLVHVDARTTERVLKRARKLSSHPHARLNKAVMTVQCAQDDAISPLTGTAMSKALHTATGTDVGRYMKRKQHTYRTVGYDGPTGLAHFELDQQHVGTLAELLVGLRETVPVKSLHLEDTRFNIPITRARAGAGMLSGPPMPSLIRTNLALTTESGAVLSTLQFETRQARALLPDLPPEHDRLVFTRNHLLLAVKTGAANLHIQFGVKDFDVPQRLGDFGPDAEFITHLLHPASGDLHIEVLAEGATAPCPLSFGISSLEHSASPILRAYIRAFADGSWLCRRAGVSADAHVAPDQFANQNADLALLRAGLSGEGISWSGTFDGELDLKDGPVGTLFVRFVELGEVVFGAALSCVGPAAFERDGTTNKVEVCDARVTIEREVTIPRSATARREALTAEWSSLAESWLVARGAAACFT